MYVGRLYNCNFFLDKINFISKSDEENTLISSHFALIRENREKRLIG